ncbi:hypothetical protein CN265_09230 [Priestia megaterium]|nr:hypothetical protein CN265_09230 [Priestia megaterium]
MSIYFYQQIQWNFREFISSNTRIKSTVGKSYFLLSKIFMKAVKYADIRIIMQIYECNLMKRKFTLQTIF